jgi:hypothetical protein
VEGPKNAGQALTILGILLQGNEIAIQLMEVFVALNEELTDDIVLVVYSFSLRRFAATVGPT